MALLQRTPASAKMVVRGGGGADAGSCGHDRNKHEQGASDGQVGFSEGAVTEPMEPDMRPRKRARKERTPSALPPQQQQATAGNAVTSEQPVQQRVLQPAAAPAAAPPPASGSTAAATVAAQPTTAPAPTLPELQLLPDGRLAPDFEPQVSAALRKALEWLRLPWQARQQFLQQYYAWLHGGDSGSGMRAFQSAYTLLQDAVSSGERDYMASVMGSAWGVNV